MNPSKTEIMHTGMVADLTKDPEAIRDNLTCLQTDLLHMMAGVNDEAAELLEAIALAVFDGEELDVENVIEELGDLEFYLNRTRSSLAITRESLLTQIEPALALEASEHTLQRPNLVKACFDLMAGVGQYTSCVKKYCIYGKPFDRAMMMGAMSKIEIQLAYFRSVVGVKWEAVLQCNYHKLANKETGRYKSGTYSDEAAIRREDKN